MRLFITIALLTASFVGGWQLREIQAQRDVLNLQAAHAEQFVAAQQRARQREQHLQQKMQEIQHETQHQLAEISAMERAAADNRVRELAKNYAAGGAAGKHSPVASGCQTERARARMLAQLLTELNELAEQFAATADRNRINGLACEKAYETVRKGH